MERAERSKGLEEDEVECRENVGLDVRCGVRIKMGSTGPSLEKKGRGAQVLDSPKFSFFQVSL